MKRLIVFPFAFFAAVTLVAADKPQPPAQAQTDSPLVQAAKRANRLGKKPGFVITNDNLRSLTGPARITTTDQTHIPTAARALPPPTPTPEMVAAEEAAKKKAKADADAARQKQREAARQQRLEYAASQAEGAEGLYDDDPAQTEHAMQQAARPATSSQPTQSTNTTPKP